MVNMFNFFTFSQPKLMYPSPTNSDKNSQFQNFIITEWWTDHEAHTYDWIFLCVEWDIVKHTQSGKKRRQAIFYWLLVITSFSKHPATLTCLVHMKQFGAIGAA